MKLFTFILLLVYIRSLWDFFFRSNFTKGFANLVDIFLIFVNFVKSTVIPPEHFLFWIVGKIEQLNYISTFFPFVSNK